ncbi:MAG: DUF1275 domain-containing protein [Pseudonocardia sp.]|nr:DUF1275 domain-containing protein [Pseudonocardia sp.]
MSDRTLRWAGIVRDPVHGPLPGLLFLLTAVTGVIDAVSLLTLGRVFVANITGTIVTLGLALAGTLGIVRETALVALVTFVLGAYAGGKLISRFSGHRGRLLAWTTAIELVFVVAAIPAAVPLTVTVAPTLPLRAVVAAAVLAFGMGVQNAAVRRLKVPDITTTVVTMAITGLAADEHGGGRATIVRRVVAVLMLLAGAALGALLVLRVGPAWALIVAAVMIAVVLAVAVLTSRTPQDWHAPR